MQSARFSNNYSQLEETDIGGSANTEEFETQHSNHTTVWNVGHKAPEKDTINNWKCGDAFWSKNCWYWGILTQVGGCFVEKKVLCLVLLTYLYTVLPLHSPFHAAEQKYSHSHGQVNTVAVSSKPLSKCTVRTSWRALVFHSFHTLPSKHKHHNRRYAPQTQHVTSTINNRFWECS